MNKKDFKKGEFFLFILGILIFLGMVYLLLSNNASYFDNFVYNIVAKMNCKVVTIIFLIISYFCSTFFLITCIILIMLLSKDNKKAFYICLNLGLCCLINQILKLVFQRERPVDINIITEKGFSFPSGHSMASMAFYGMWIYLINVSKMAKNKKVIYSTLLAIFILLIGVSRIYLGVHFATDVVAGFSLAFAYLIFFINVVYKKRITESK